MNGLKKCSVLILCLTFFVLNVIIFFLLSPSACLANLDKENLRNFYYEDVISSDSEEFTSADSAVVLPFNVNWILKDRFPWHIKTLKIPSYNLAEDFPQEHVKTFNDFLLFCASLEARWDPTETGIIYQLPLVKARLEQNIPLQYEDFLAALPLSICIIRDNRYLRTKLFGDFFMLSSYVHMFLYKSRNAFFVENILEPLSRDLKDREYRGFHYKSNNIPQFFREFANDCYSDRRNFITPPDLMGVIYYISLKIPEEIILMNHYAYTFLLVHEGKLQESYRELNMYKAPKKHDDLYFKKRPPRPYYNYSDEDRYLWFEFLQTELRSSGHADFADSILETEIEHYRELIVWQLRLRAYLVQRLYEYADNDNLSTLSNLLTSEYINLKDDLFFQQSFKNAIEALREIDGNVNSSSLIDEAKGVLVLPWIDREALDREQGIESELLSPDRIPISWKVEMESINDKTKVEMKDSYERSIFCIRVLSVVSDKLYREKDLKTMTELHSKLHNNKDVSNTYADKNRSDLNALRNTYGDGGNHLELDPQTRIDLRRCDLIVNDYLGHQARRKNGDMTIGDMILPWVKVQEIES